MYCWELLIHFYILFCGNLHVERLSDNTVLSVIAYGCLIPDHTQSFLCPPISTETFCSMETSKTRIILSKRFNLVFVSILWRTETLILLFYLMVHLLRQMTHLLHGSGNNLTLLINNLNVINRHNCVAWSSELLNYIKL